jgi:hypothetical protein
LEKYSLDSWITPLFASGNPAIVAGISAVELAFLFIENVHPTVLIVEPTYRWDRTVEYWTGWSLAYAPWALNVSFETIMSLCK